MYTQHLVDKLNAIAYKYKDIIERAIVSLLLQPAYKNTGAGAASLTVDVVDGDANKSPQLIINFDDHILFLDKKKLQWTKQPDVKKLIAWAETKSFDKVPGYTGKRQVDKVKAAERIAWAIAVSKKKNDIHKRKPWRKKSIGVILKEMNQYMLKEFDAAIDEDLVDAIKRAGLS